jgi:hypothetical protein
MLWFAAAAWGAEPVVTTDEAGVVRATAVVEASLPEVLALIQSPEKLFAATRGGDEDSSLTTTAADAGCMRVTYNRKTPIGPVSYVARGCPTAAGLRTTLLESESFESMSYEWTARPVDGGTEVTYTWQGRVTLPVPGWIVRKSTENSIRETMGKVTAHFDR